MSEWKRRLWGEIATLEYGKSLSGYRESAGDVPVYGTNGQIGWTNETLCDQPGVIIGRKGAYRGVHYSSAPFFVIDTAFYLKPLPGQKLNPKWAYYQLLTQDINLMDSGSAIPSTSRDDFYALELFLPPLDEQIAIASLLTSFDDKIEANRRQNETLEATARAIFKSWFVDFDPVHAKASGEHPPGMDAATAALFPDSFEESELGLIPSGWQVVAIGDHIKANKGLSYKGAHLEETIEDGLPMHNLNSVNEWGGYKFDGIKFYSGDYKPRHEVRPGDLIVANTEQGFNLLLIASPAIVPAVFGDKGIISHHIYKVEIKRKSPLTRFFLYHMIMLPPFRDVLQGYTNGTTVNMLPSDAFEKPRFVMPSAELMQRFDALVAPMLEQVERNYEKSMTLTETRDALLPRLVSGELRVGEL